MHHDNVIDFKISKFQNFKISSTLGEKYNEQSNAGVSREEKCYYCDRKKNRKMKTQCKNCENYVCKEHTVTYCQKCDKDAKHSSDNSEY